MALLSDLRAAAVAALGAAGASGYNVSAAQVDAVYFQLSQQAFNARDVTALVNINSDWASALLNAEPKGSFAPASHQSGYFTTQAYADWFYRSNYMAQRNWIAPEDFQEAPLTVISPEHVAAGLVPLTEAERAAFDAALESGAGVRADGSVGLSFQLEAYKGPAPVTTVAGALEDAISRPVNAPLGATREQVDATIALLEGDVGPGGGNLDGMTLPQGDGFTPAVLPAGANVEPAPASSSSGWALIGVAVLVLAAGWASSQRPR
jgi:hypothetical protein